MRVKDYWTLLDQWFDPEGTVTVNLIDGSVLTGTARVSGYGDTASPRTACISLLTIPSGEDVYFDVRHVVTMHKGK